MGTSTGKRSESRPRACVHQGFHLMAKPVGPLCNLRCVYCFYREKEALFDESENFRMSDGVLEVYVTEYLKCQPGPCVVFDWQGGEPALAGIEFFERALVLQAKYGHGRQIQNTFQTNGTMVDDDWCAFLAKNRFLVGLSLDGPEVVHDAFRADQRGNPTFARALRALEGLQRRRVEVNVLATVNSETVLHPLEVYAFFKQHGVRFIQFIPIVEREADSRAARLRIRLAPPPALTREEEATSVTPWSVGSEQYGQFLIRVYDEWMRNDVGTIFVMNFEWSLAAFAGAGPGVCYLSPRCGRNLILEHNGDVFSCDHFMYPAYRLGNILRRGLAGMVESGQQKAFGASKETALPAECRRCDVLDACRGGCPKHRFAMSPAGEPGLNYLCAGFRRFYHHVNPSMRQMARLVQRGIPAAKIMKAGEQGTAQPL